MSGHLAPYTVRIVLACAALLAGATAAPAGAAPSCPVAQPKEISTPKLVVDQLWQRYRGLPGEHRCCAVVCQAIIENAVPVEDNALQNNAVARDPRYPQSVRNEALDDANAGFALRGQIAKDAQQCMNETRPDPRTDSCRPISLSVEWEAWCAKLYEKFERIAGAFSLRVAGFHAAKPGRVPALHEFKMNVVMRRNGTPSDGGWGFNSSVGLPLGTERRDLLAIRMPAFPGRSKLQSHNFRIELSERRQLGSLPRVENVGKPPCPET